MVVEKPAGTKAAWNTSRGYKRLHRILAAIGQGVDALLVVGLASLLLVVLIQVASRLIRHSLPWTEEMTRYTFLWTTFLGMAAGFRYAEHARVTLFVNLGPKRIRALAVHLHFLVSFLFFAVVLVAGWSFLRQQFLSQEIGYAVRIPMWIIGACVPTSAVFALLGLIESTYFNPETRAILEGERLEFDDEH